MKVMTLAEAIGGIDDDLVSGAIVYQPKRAKNGSIVNGQCGGRLQPVYAL